MVESESDPMGGQLKPIVDNLEAMLSMALVGITTDEALTLLEDLKAYIQWRIDRIKLVKVNSTAPSE